MATYNPNTLVMNDGSNAYNYAGGAFYAECGTASDTQTKVVSVPEITELNAGTCLRVKFTYAQNYNGQPKLQVNSLTAANIVRYGTTAAGPIDWYGGEVVDFVYDGTNFIIVNGGKIEQIHGKIDKVTNSVTNDLAKFDSGGGLIDSGYNVTDFATRGNIAWVENGNTATDSFKKGRYVLWKGTLCITNQPIASGETWSSGTGGNLTVVSGGVANNILQLSYHDKISSNVTVQNITSTNICSVTPEKGEYLVTMYVKFASNATGLRSIELVGTASFSYAGATNIVPAVSNQPTFVYGARYLSTSGGTTYHIATYQNSGGALNVTSAELNMIPIRTTI